MLPPLCFDSRGSNCSVEQGPPRAVTCSCCQCSESEPPWDCSRGNRSVGSWPGSLQIPVLSLFPDLVPASPHSHRSHGVRGVVHGPTAALQMLRCFEMVSPCLPVCVPICESGERGLGKWRPPRRGPLPPALGEMFWHSLLAASCKALPLLAAKRLQEEPAPGFRAWWKPHSGWDWVRSHQRAPITKAKQYDNFVLTPNAEKKNTFHMGVQHEKLVLVA